jgi:hypothetical protein
VFMHVNVDASFSGGVNFGQQGTMSGLPKSSCHTMKIIKRNHLLEFTLYFFFQRHDNIGKMPLFVQCPLLAVFECAK